MNDKVKMSVFLDRDLHRKLKIAAAERGTSIQQMVEDAVGATISSVANPNPLPPARPMTQKEVRSMERNFARIVEGGDETTVKCFALFVRAMEMLVENGAGHEPR